jgi:tetratricopeptide (TPR) repeat protein
METLFTWLHLSDLQVQAPRDDGAAPGERILAALRHDLEESADARIDAVLVSGDVAWSGQREEYVAADAFLIAVARAVGLGPERVYVVAGNHDVDRNADRAPLIAKLLGELRQGRRRLDAALEHAKAREVLSTRLYPFAVFAATFGPPPADDDAAPEELLWWSHKVDGKGGLKVRIVGLCSAFLAEGDADRGVVRIGERQLADAASTLKPGELVVALSHHPARGGWLADERDTEVWLREHAHVHVTGHAHDPIAEEARAGAPGPFVWITAGAAPVRRRGATPERRLGYGITQVVRGGDGALALRVQPRRWSPEQGRFVPDERHLPAGETAATRALRLTLPPPRPSTAPPPAAKGFAGAREERGKAFTPTPPAVKAFTPGPPAAKGLTPAPGSERPYTPAPAAARPYTPPPPAERPYTPAPAPVRSYPPPAEKPYTPAPERPYAPAPERPFAPASAPAKPYTQPPPPVAPRPAPRAAGPFEGPGALPATAIPLFADRTSELEALAQALADPGTQSVVVAGLGGVGKTALVQHFVATRAPALFEESAWLDARDLQGELARLTRRFGRTEVRPPRIDEAQAFLKAALEGRRVLLVVDNLSPGLADVRALPVPGGASRTVVTSRILTLHEDLGRGARQIRVAPWDEVTSREHLRALVPALSAESDGALGGLVQRVGGLPLAVRLLGRLLLRADASAAGVQARLDRDALGTLDVAARSGESNVTSTFRPAFEALDPSLRNVLVALAACAAQTRAAVVAEVAGMREDEASMGLEGLADQSLVEWHPDAERPFRLHPVVRVFLRGQPGAGEAEAAHEGLVMAEVLAEADPRTSNNLERDLPEVIAVIDRKLTRGDAAGAWDLLKAILGPLERRGHYADFVALAGRIVRATPEDGPTAAAVLADMGLAQVSMGDLANARDSLAHALALAEDRGLHETQAIALGGLGRVLAGTGDLEQAVAHHHRAAALHEKLGLTRQHAVDLTNLGLAYRRMGEVGDAIEYLERALAVYQDLGELEGRAEVLGGLGLCFRDIGELGSAVEYFQRALAIHEELGRRAGQATMLGNLGNTYRALGDLGEAVDHLERARAIYEDLGLQEGLGAALGNLGATYRALGETAKARTHYEKALATFRRTGLPDDHPHVRVVLAALVEVRRGR